jgi:hypothetical protein
MDADVERVGGIVIVALASVIVCHRIVVGLCDACAQRQRRALRDDYELLPTDARRNTPTRWTCLPTAVAPSRAHTSAYASARLVL